MDELIFRIEDALTNEDLIDELNMDLVAINPENTIFQPAKQLNAIMELAGSSYGKKKDEVNKWMGHITKEDLCTLYEREKCASFNQYCNALELNILFPTKE